MAPTVSVIVPIYDVERYVAQCLDSVLGQTLQDIEVIAVDDCGSDGSMAIVERAGERDGRVVIVRHTKNSGLGAARNTGLAAATGRYVAFVDSDDWLVPDALAKEVAAIEAAGANCVWAKMVDYEEATGRKRVSSAEGVCPGPFRSSFAESFKPSWSACDKLFRRGFLVDNRLSFPGGVRYEDTEFFFKTHILSPSVFVLDEALYVYRRRGGSIMTESESGRGHCEDLCVIARNCRSFLDERGLFADNRGEFLGFLSKLFASFLNSAYYKERMFVAVKETLPALGFPGDFGDLSGHYGYIFLDAVMGGEPGPKWLYKPLSALNKLNPHPGLRRRWQTVLRVRYRAK